MTSMDGWLWSFCGLEESLVTVHFYSDSGMHSGWTEGPGTDGFGDDSTVQIPAHLFAAYRVTTSAAMEAEGALQDWLDQQEPEETP